MALSPKVIIEKALEVFFDENWSYKDFLTEDDIRCRLFVVLQEALKENTNVFAHSEIRWYGDSRGLGENKLKYRSDIVIINHTDLSVEQNNIFKLPSKGYGFDKYYTIIEIKLRRTNNKNSDEAYEKIIQEDVDKLIEIKEKTTGGWKLDKKYFALIFDKRRKRKKLVDIDNIQNIDWETWMG